MKEVAPGGWDAGRGAQVPRRRAVALPVVVDHHGAAAQSWVAWGDSRVHRAVAVGSRQVDHRGVGVPGPGRDTHQGSAAWAVHEGEGRAVVSGLSGLAECRWVWLACFLGYRACLRPEVK